MHKDAIGDYYVINGEIKPLIEIKNEIKFEKSVYEVIRLIGGIPLFLNDHIKRLENSTKLLDFSINEHIKDIYKCISTLLTKNNISDMNFKLIVSKSEGTETSIDYICYFIKSVYPNKTDYLHGVTAILFNTVRENPNIKSLNMTYKELVMKQLSESNAYEAILVNEKNSMTEGSRSNLFIIKDGCLFTPPPEDILIGITRQKVIKVAFDLGINVFETELTTDSLSDADAVFITGTSPKILPISKVDEKTVGDVSNITLRRLMDAYNHEIEKYLLVF